MPRELRPHVTDSLVLFLLPKYFSLQTDSLPLSETKGGSLIVHTEEDLKLNKNI